MMKHNITAQHGGVRIRPITMKDAEFIFHLRRHPKLAQYLGEFSSDYSDHLTWLKNYFTRSGDYYFCIEAVHTNRRIGTIALYNQSETEAEWGRIIIEPPYPAAPASVLLIYQLAFEKLRLSRVYCRSVKNNEKVISFHDRSGAERVGIEPDGITIRGTSYDMIVHQVTRSLWPQVQQKLVHAAAIAQRFLEELN